MSNEKTYTLTFTPEQLVILNDALVEMPYRTVAPLIYEINMQIAEHDRGDK